MMAADPLVDRFEAERGRLRSIAQRLLGSAAEADDAVQESWLRLRAADDAAIGDLAGWLTVVVSRIALDMLRARKARREETLVVEDVEPVLGENSFVDPEQEALLAEAVGMGLMIMLDRLAPPERLAFVLHDVFGLSFDAIAPIVGRSTVAARQLASRARRRLRGAENARGADAAAHRRIIGAFFAASRDGDFEALLRLLDPDAALTMDHGGEATVVSGAQVIARRATLGAAARARWSAVMLVDGAAGIVVAPFGRPQLAMTFAVERGRIGRIAIVTDPARLARLDLKLLDPS